MRHQAESEQTKTYTKSHVNLITALSNAGVIYSGSEMDIVIREADCPNCGCPTKFYDQNNSSDEGQPFLLCLNCPTKVRPTIYHPDVLFKEEKIILEAVGEGSSSRDPKRTKALERMGYRVLILPNWMLTVDGSATIASIIKAWQMAK